MPAWKLDLNFRAESQGWKETYYADFGVASFEGMYPIAKKLAGLRVALSADPVVITSYSISDPLTDGQQGETVDFGPYMEAPSNVAYGAGDPATSINVGFSNATQKRSRRIYMRGIPDIVVTHFGRLDSVEWGNWSKKFNALRDYLLGLVNGQLGGTNYGWYKRARVAAAKRAEYAYALNSTTPVFTMPTDFFSAEDLDRGKAYVRFSGFNNRKSPLNREMIVHVITRETCSPITPIAAFPMLNAGQCQRYQWVPEFVPADRIRVERAGTRRPGAPPLQRAGRSKNRPRG